MSPIVAHFMRVYLPGTMTFVYQYLKHLRRYQSIVLAVSQEHPERFPFPNVYTPGLAAWQLLFTRADRRFFHRQRLVEPFFVQTIRSQQVQVLHAHFGYTGVFNLPVQRQTGLPLVTTFYGVDVSAFPKRPGWRESYRRLFEAGALFLAEGSHLREALIALGCPPHKAMLQRIGVDLNQFSYRPPPPTTEGIRILMCGRFVEKKGFEFGIRAFSRIVADFPQAQLRLIGDGPLETQLVELIRSFGPAVEQRVLRLGRVNHAAFAQEAEHAHIFMAPSVIGRDGDSEGGAPTVLLEMQARGLPVLSTFHADIPEVVVDGGSGLLVPERDEAALGEKLHELLAHPERWADMGRVGRNHIEQQHDIVKLAQQLEDKYEQLLH